MKPRSLKNLILIFIAGALLIAGLFLFARKLAAPPPAEISNPDQLDFRDSNTLPAAPETAAETAPEAAPAVPPAEPPSTLTAEESRAWQSFESVLASHNDNDPRLDRDLKSLTPALRAALAVRYQTIPAEERNARGLVVFLIARDLRTADGAEFLKKVYQEEPCLSLDDCSKTGQEDPHFSGANQTTMNYPQLAGLFQIEKQLSERPELLRDPAMRAEILDVLKNAENFPVPAVQNKARAIRRKYGL